MKKKLLEFIFKLLWIFAKYYINKHKIFVIWISWSVWKTSWRTIIFQILKNNLKQKKIYSSPKNFNWELWMSLSIFWIENYYPSIFNLIKILLIWYFKFLFWKKLYDILILEYWVDHIWEMDFLLSICKPNIWIITKIWFVHSYQFWNPQQIAKEKFKLIFNSKEVVFLNWEDKFSIDAYQKVSVDKILYSIWQNNNSKNLISDLFIDDYKLKYENWSIECKIELNIKNHKYKIKTNIVWKENWIYIWIWMIILDILNFKYFQKNFFEQQKEYSFDFEFLPSRFSVFEWLNDSILIDSTYNAEPLSMRMVIDNCLNLHNSNFLKYKKIFCLWEMRELWEFCEIEHKKLAWIIWHWADYLFLIWESMKKYMIDELKIIWFDENKIFRFSDSKILWEKLIQFLDENKQENFFILFKWSQNTIFLEEAIKVLIKNEVDKKKLCRQEKYWLEKKTQKN